MVGEFNRKMYGRHIFDFGQSVKEGEIRKTYQIIEMEEKNRRMLYGGAEKPTKKIKNTLNQVKHSLQKQQKKPQFASRNISMEVLDDSMREI